MPAKTLYVKDEQLWDKAKRLAGHQGFSGVIMRLLAKWVADKEKQEAMKSGKEFSEIELWVGGDEHQMWHPKDPLGGDHKIAFTGRLLHSSEHEVVLGVYPQVDVYQMGGGQLVVYRTWRPPFLIDSGLSPGYDGGATYKVFSDIEELLQNSEVLDTNWTGHPEEDQLRALVERPRTVRERLIITIAEHVKLEHPQRSAVWQKEYVREFLLGLNTHSAPPKMQSLLSRRLINVMKRKNRQRATCVFSKTLPVLSALNSLSALINPPMCLHQHPKLEGMRPRNDWGSGTSAER